jgi:hypothetical protein
MRSIEIVKSVVQGRGGCVMPGLVPGLAVIGVLNAEHPALLHALALISSAPEPTGAFADPICTGEVVALTL